MMTAAAPLLARKREEHRAAFRRKLSGSHSALGGAHLAIVVKKLVDTRHLLHAAETRATKAEQQIQILVRTTQTSVIAPPDLESTDLSEGLSATARPAAASIGNEPSAACDPPPMVSRDNSEAFDLRAKVEELKLREDEASTRAAAAMAKCDELKLVVSANSRKHEEEMSTLRQKFDKLRSAGDKKAALAECEDARRVEHQSVARQSRPDFVECDALEDAGATKSLSVRASNNVVLSAKAPAALLQAQEIRVAETTHKAIEVARDSSNFAELNSLRSSMAAMTCRYAASHVRCEAAEAKCDALQRAIPSLRHDEKVQDDDVTMHLEHSSTAKSDRGNLSDTVVALAAICTALQAERAESLVPNGQNSTPGDASHLKELEDKLSVSETKVKILEAHLSTVDKHLTALAQGKHFQHSSKNFTYSVHCSQVISRRTLSNSTRTRPSQRSQC